MDILVYCFFGLIVLLIVNTINQYHTIKTNKKTIQYLIDERKMLRDENLKLKEEVINK